MLLLDVTVTSHCEAHTGVQRVTRRLFQELSSITDVLPICYDPFAQCWRELDSTEWAKLNPPEQRFERKRRRPKWSNWQKLHGYWDKFRKQPRALKGQKYAGLIVTEIFTQDVFKAYQQLFPLIEGPRVALFHDILPLQLKHLTPIDSVKRFPAYLDELKQFDTVLTNSKTTRSELISYWENDTSEHPPVTALLLGSDIAPKKSRKAIEGRRVPHVLSVGTLEGRKNHLTLLTAAERLWDMGLKFELSLVGMLNKETGSQVAQKIESMRHQKRPVKWLGALGEQDLVAAYQQCDFTVYPSLAEGFGLPVIESLFFGKACVCSEDGATAEIAEGGGCLTVNTASTTELCDAIETLLLKKETRSRLEEEALNRHFKNWNDCAQDLLDYMQLVPHHRKKRLSKEQSLTNEIVASQ